MKYFKISSPSPFLPSHFTHLFFFTTYLMLWTLSGCDNGQKLPSPYASITPPPSKSWESTISDKDKLYPYCQNFIGEYYSQESASTQEQERERIKTLIINGISDRTQVKIIFFDNQVAVPIIGNDPIYLYDGSTLTAGCRNNIISLSYTSINTLETVFFRITQKEDQNLTVDTLDELGSLRKSTQLIKHPIKKSNLSD